MISMLLSEAAKTLGSSLTGEDVVFSGDAVLIAELSRKEICLLH